MTKQDNYELFQPVANNSPGNTLFGKLRFFVRSLLDLQMSSVYQHLSPWLKTQNGALLEVGCGAQPYRHLVPAACHYTGLDWEQAEAHFKYRFPDTIYYSGELFPFKDGSFDNLFHTEVLEHVYHAGQFLGECHRVLKPSGTMFFTVPFQARYHYIPHDYFRYTPAALKLMLAEAGFREIEIRPQGSDITVAAYKSVSVIYRWLRSGLSGLPAGILFLPLVVPLVVVGWMTLRLALGSHDDCLGYTVTAKA